MKKMVVKGILFDFDGTLTWPGSLDFPAIKRQLGCPSDKTILEYLEIQPKAVRPGLMKILEYNEQIAAEASFPNKGAEQCLLRLRNRQIPYGILTRNSLKSVKKALEKFIHITPADFAIILTREVTPPKPHPGGVFEAARQMGVLPSELMVAGDYRFDVMAGKAAGAFTVLLTNGGNSTMSSHDPEPDHTIEYLDELLHIL